MCTTLSCYGSDGGLDVGLAEDESNVVDRKERKRQPTTQRFTIFRPLLLLYGFCNRNVDIPYPRKNKPLPSINLSILNVNHTTTN